MTNVSFVVTLHLLKAGNLKIWKDCKTVECLCLIIAIGLPMAYIWVPIHDQNYQVLSCDNNDSSTWNKDAVILSSLILVMCIEVATVCAILSGLFCYLHW